MTRLLDTGRSRKVAIMAAGMSAFFDLYITQGLLPEFQRVFGASVAEASLTVTVATLAVAFSAPFAGGLSDRFGRGRVMVTALIGLGLATLGAALARSLPQLLLWRALEGLCIPGIFASAVAYIGEECPGEQARRMTALYICGAVLGSVFGRFTSGLIAAHSSWQYAFLAMGTLNLMFAGVIYATLPPSTRFRAPAAAQSGSGGARQQLAQRQFLATLGIGFCLLFTQVATFTYINFFLARPPFNLSMHDLSFLSCVFLVGMIAPVISARVERRLASRTVLTAALGISSLGMLITLGHGLAWVLVGLTLNSAGVFVGQSMATASLPRLVPDARSLAVGLYLTCYYIGGSAGGTAPSLLFVHYGWPACVALIIGVQCLASALAWGAWGQRHSTPEERLESIAAEAAT
jgi:YNFM family putative membrane transporter